MAGFLDFILNIFDGGGTDSDKKRIFKRLVKDIAKNKYSRFYRVKNGELDPAFAKFFYDVYKIISPAQVFLQNAAKSEELRAFVIKHFCGKKLSALEERLSAGSINERAKASQARELVKELKSELKEFSGGFDAALKKTIDDAYNIIIAFNNFVHFDFYFLLRKFDPGLAERNFAYTPRFTALRAEYASDELKDFLEAASGVDPDQNWKTALELLKGYKGGMDVVSPPQWAKILVLLRDIKRSRIIELVIRHVSKDPFWQGKPQFIDEHIVDSYLAKKKAEVESIISGMLNTRRNSQIEQLAGTVFGGPLDDRMKNYTAKNNEVFLKKSLGGFTQVEGINYLKAFLLDYVKKDIHELNELFLVRGQWSNLLLSKQMSESFHDIAEVQEQILAFDDKLEPDGEHGSRLKQALVKADRDKGQAKYVRIILDSINGEARDMVTAAAQALVVTGRFFKNILEDYPKSNHELILNWKELESGSEIPLNQRLAAAYKKIYYFVEILRLCVRPEDGDDE